MIPLELGLVEEHDDVRSDLRVMERGGEGG